jgi:catechol 2,3-dioxygenase-like lactoylglutathione lyase family enzyme
VPARLDHVTLATSEFAAGLAFYDAALAPLGLVRAAEFGDEEEEDPELEAAGWGEPSGPVVIWLVRAAAPTTAAHLSLRAGSRADVDAFFAAAVAAGGTPQRRPRRWTVFRRGDFVAAVTDADGNTLEVVADE